MPPTPENLALQSHSQENPPISLSPEIVSMLPQLYQILETQFLTCWQDLNTLFIMNDVKQWAQHLSTTAREFQFSPLLEYGEAVLAYAQHCDVKNVKKIIADFPKRLDEIKSYL